MSEAFLLVFAVLAVGVLHTLVPDHWAPIAAIARQRGWTPRQAGKAAAGAGLGHTISTLVLGIIMWLGGVELGAHIGRSVSLISSVALIVFGAWVALGAWRELREEAHEHGDHGHGHAHHGHAHVHRHGAGQAHTHWHEHHAEDWHAIAGSSALAPESEPMHRHEHKTSARTALLLILGSSPMIEGLPVFFRASHFGIQLLAVMALVFSIATIGTYVATVMASVAGLQKVSFGRFEQYGEVLSGLFIVVLGAVFLFLPLQ